MFLRVQEGERMPEKVMSEAEGLEEVSPVPYGGLKMRAGGQTLPVGDKYHQMCVQSGCHESNSCPYWWIGWVRSLGAIEGHLPGLPVCRVGP